MINSAMAVNLQGIYSVPIDRKTYNRKKIKIIVDSLIEQLCDYYFSRKPSGVSNVRVLINRDKGQFQDSQDKVILDSFSKVLRSYEDVFATSYCGHTEEVEKFVDEKLKELTRNISNHSNLSNNPEIQRLKGML
ncbi:MAG: hypothetical protein N4A62_19585 [Marinisporobacter sp.]|jgi:hypothetical protein|nr:hypothetical protein [Marinisporobacter sp.]